MTEKTIFVKIIDGEIPCTKVYEDEIVLAFLDINPSNIGHTLVIPKTPSIDATEASPEVLAHLMMVGQKIARAQRRVLDATGNNFIFNCGADGGQEVFHTHMHVVPRYKDDGVYKTPTHTKYAEGEAVLVAAKLTAVL